MFGWLVSSWFVCLFIYFYYSFIASGETASPEPDLMLNGDNETEQAAPDTNEDIMTVDKTDDATDDKKVQHFSWL